MTVKTSTENNVNILYFKILQILDQIKLKNQKHEKL